MIVPCRTIDKLLRCALACPRRVQLMEDANSIYFKADDGTRFYIARVDFDQCMTEMSYRASFFVKAIKTEKGKQDYCESLNYGKPDWKS